MPSVRQSVVASVARRYPFYSGCGTLANHRLVQRLAGASTEVTWNRVHGGHWVCAPLADYVGRAVYYVGELDRKITWACSRLVRQGDTVLDIGANLGLVSVILSAMVGPTGAVHAFEPIPQMQRLIKRAVTRNGISNITLHPFALGATDGTVCLSVPRGHAGSASFVAERQQEDSDPIDVPVRTLSSVLAAHDVAPIRLVKIDVEGFEDEVLSGAEEYFTCNPPYAIIFELNDMDVDIRHHPTVARLDRLGYGFFSLPRRMMHMRAERFDPNDGNSHGVGHDFLAVRRGSDYEEAARLVGAI